MTPKNNVRIAHLTKNRVRFVCERIGEDCDESRLEAQISEFRYAKSVRVNKKAKSIIVGFESNLDEIMALVYDYAKGRGLEQIYTKEAISEIFALAR